MILKIAVVVPTFNNPTTIQNVIDDILSQSPFDVLVIDDGSDQPVEHLEQRERDRVRIVRFNENRGKGACLQFAIQDLVSRGYTHMLTIDGDGQHKAGEIEKLVGLAKQHPWALIIGNRRMNADTVPEISRFGRKFSNFWVNYQTGLKVLDSQSGFRLYPLMPLQMMTFFTSRYDFEIEVLIRFLWGGGEIYECEIEVIYQPPSERVSHFHKFWDNVRISILNTILVAMTLVRSQRDPLHLGLAVGLGVTIGTTPFFGFHSLIAVGMALLFRLNVVGVLLGSQISIPPIAPFLVFASMEVSQRLFHLSSGFKSWMVGAMVLGPALGALSGVAVYALMTWFELGRAANRSWSGKSRGGRLGNGFLKFVLRRIGLRAGYICLWFIVPYFWLFAPNGRRALNEYYRILNPKLGWWMRQLQVLRHFFKFGQVLMDRVYQGFQPKRYFSARASGLEYILSSMEKSQGLILLGAHIGGWDLAAALLGDYGFADYIFVIEYRAEGMSFQTIKNKMDPSHVHKVESSKSDAIFEIHQALKAGQCIGLMGDRPIGDRFELFPFLGKLAPFDVTAFRLAVALQTPLIVTFGCRSGKDERVYDFYATEPSQFIFIPGNSREVQLYEWVSAYVKKIEEMVRRYPEQWFNFYPFWSSLPASPTGRPIGSGTNSLLEELTRPRDQKFESGPDAKPNVEK